MAKKKTENIKAAPVLRANGDQPKTKTYQIMDPWKDLDKVNLVDVKSVDGEIIDVKVNGEPAGGGGGGFVPVLVNITNDLQDDIKIITPFVSDDNVINTEVLINAGMNDSYQLLTPSIGFIDFHAQQVQLDEVVGTGGVTVTKVSNYVYQLNINGAGNIRIV